ncbi:hypothetical protein B0H12DRAFT_1153185, partial [Mycena haematopus]
MGWTHPNPSRRAARSVGVQLDSYVHGPPLETRTLWTPPSSPRPIPAASRSPCSSRTTSTRSLTAGPPTSNSPVERVASRTHRRRAHRRRAPLRRCAPVVRARVQLLRSPRVQVPSADDFNLDVRIADALAHCAVRQSALTFVQPRRAHRRRGLSRRCATRPRRPPRRAHLLTPNSPSVEWSPARWRSSR